MWLVDGNGLPPHPMARFFINAAAVQKITEADAPKGGRRGLRFTLKLTWVNRVGIADNELPASELSGPAAGRSGIVERGRVALPPVE